MDLTEFIKTKECSGSIVLTSDDGAELKFERASSSLDYDGKTYCIMSPKITPKARFARDEYFVFRAEQKENRHVLIMERDVGEAIAVLTAFLSSLCDTVGLGMPAVLEILDHNYTYLKKRIEVSQYEGEFR